MIKLKETLKKGNNKLSRIKVIAKKLRSRLENYYGWDEDKGCFKNTCHDITRDLIDELRKSGIYAYRVNGLYYGASNNYEPDMSDWNNEERWEYYDITDHGQFNEMFGFNHWWVVADNKWIIDITADQFHPDSPDEYRVVITDIGDSEYSA